MPRKCKFPCGSCQKECVTDCLLCGKEVPTVVASSEEMNRAIVDDGESVANASMVTPDVKGKKLGIKRIKTKQLNISKGKLKSVSTSKNFSFLNLSVQKQTLRVNNRELARNLARSKQEISQLNNELQKQRSQNQELFMERNKLQRLVGLKDEQIQQEVELRFQEQMQEIESWMKQLTQSMIHSSAFIQKIYEKCKSCCPRLSTDSSGSLSFGSFQAGLKPMGSSSRPLFKDKTSQDELMTNYLSKADEFLAPPGGRVYQDEHSVADMSVIAEQSMIENEEELYMAHPLPSVPEITSDSNTRKSNPVSKLPHRILKPTNDSASNSNSNAYGKTVDLVGSNRIGINNPELHKKNSEDAHKQSVVTKENDNSKTKEDGEKTKPEIINDNEKSVGKTKSKDKKRNSMSVQESKNDLKKMNTAVDSCMSKTAVPDDIAAEIDRSAFGFGGSFVEDLVSGSPIAPEKRRETFVKVKHSEKMESPIMEEPKDLNQKERAVVTKPQVETKTRKDDKTAYTVKGKTNITVKSRTDNHSSLSKLNLGRRDTFATVNPFVPESKIKRTPDEIQIPVKKNNDIDDSFKPVLSLIKSQELVKKQEMEKGTFKPVNILSKNQESDEKYDSIKDPFKPTKTLVRSPHRRTVQNASPEEMVESFKVDSLAFLSNLRGNLERNQVECLPLSEPSFGDEPTTYFNSEMEFTSVIDSTQLLESLKSGKNCPLLPMESVNELVIDGSIETQKSSKSKDNHSTKEPKKNIHSEKSDEVVYEHNEPAAVEVRTKKPGVFTFSVSRKDADGTRKPVPENVSKARSKKKKPVTPEKEERKTGADRDTFNFGDRTPTMPLEKLKEKSVYDLSMNESVMVPGNTLKNFKEREKFKIPDPKPDEHIYYLPMKPVSPDDKPVVSKSARSQSRSRSKSQKKHDDDDDDDWMPGKKPRDRSKSRSRKIEKDEDKTQRRGRSRSRVKVVAEESSENITERGHGRSKSRSDQTKEEDSSRRARSRTRREVLGSTEHENTKHQGELSDNPNQNIGKSEKQEPGLRRGRSQSRKRPTINTESVVSNSDVSSKENFRQRSLSVSSRNNSDHSDINTVKGRSESKSRVDDTELDSDDESNTNINRKGRSKSKARSQNENTDSDLEKASMKSTTNRRGRSKSKIRSKIDVDECDLDDVIEKPTLNLEVRGRSKSKARSKTCAEDRVVEMPAVNSEEKSHTRGISKSKAKDNNDNMETESEKVDRILEHNNEESLNSVRSTRSKFNPKVIDYTECDNTLEDKEEEDESPLLVRKSKSIHKKKPVYVESDSTEKDGDSDLEIVEVSKTRKSLSRSIKRKHCDMKAQESEEVERKKVKGDAYNTESFDAKSKPVRCISESSIGSDEEVLISKTDSIETFKTETWNNKRTRKSTLDVEDSDSDFVSNVKNDMLKHKTKGEVKPVKEHRKDNNVDDKIKNLTDKTTKNELNEGKERDENEIKEFNMKRLDMLFANSKRGKTSRAPNLEDMEADMNEEIDTVESESKKTSSKLHDEKFNIDGKQEIPESPAVRKRSEARKSTKKSTRKQKTEMPERSSKKSKLNLADDKMDAEDGNRSGLSTVTPAVGKEPGTKKSSKSSGTAKSSRKLKSDLIPDETPLIKVERVSGMSEDKESSLAVFKKRLTMVGAKKTAQTEVNVDDPSVKKRSQVPVPDDLEPEGSESPDNKRTRRHKTAVSYVPKPLNVKLRQGDQMFKESAISKGYFRPNATSADPDQTARKAEQMRLVIAKKTSVPKVSRDDKENVMQSVQET